jgi:hypothetical protein
MPRKLWTTYLTVTLVVFFSLSATASPLRRAVIINTAFTVKAGDAKYWSFQVGSAGANIVGRFRAEVEAATILNVLSWALTVLRIGAMVIECEPTTTLKDYRRQHQRKLASR